MNCSPFWATKISIACFQSLCTSNTNSTNSSPTNGNKRSKPQPINPTQKKSQHKKKSPLPKFKHGAELSKRMKQPKQSTLVFQSVSVFLFFLVFVFVAHGQSLLPPAKSDGFVYGKRHKVDWDAIMIEAFFDPVCPDSRDSWPPLKQALAYYGDRVWLVVHLLPLPSVSFFPFLFGFWNETFLCKSLDLIMELNFGTFYPHHSKFSIKKDQFFWLAVEH